MSMSTNVQTSFRCRAVCFLKISASRRKLGGEYEKPNNTAPKTVLRNKSTISIAPQCQNILTLRRDTEKVEDLESNETENIIKTPLKHFLLAIE